MKNLSKGFIVMLSLVLFGCQNENEIGIEEQADEYVEYNYSKDPNILYANTKAENAFSNYSVNTKLANGMYVKKIHEDLYIFDSDMALTKDQLYELEKYNEINPEPEIQVRGSVAQAAKTWADKTVYYSMNSNVNPSYKSAILAAIQEWRNQSQIKFVQRTNQKDYVEFILGNDGSYSNIGRIGGKQYVHLDSTWANKGTAMHEIGHVVGMIHEHQSFVFHNNNGGRSILIFKWDNLKSEAKSNYEKYSKGHDTYGGGIYDLNYPINSLMIYGSYSTSNAKDISKPLITYSRIGFEETYSAQRSYLSVSDRMAVAAKYGYTYNPSTDPNLPPI